MSKKAIELVEKCLATREPYLDLGYCGLVDKHFVETSELNTLLKQCTHLTTLILSNEWWTIQFDLDAWDTHESKNKGMANRLSIIPVVISNYHSLTTLAIGGYEDRRWDISKMNSFVFPEELRHLYLGGNKLVEIEGLDNCRKLKSLYLGENEIKSFNGLNNLQELQWLYLGRNNLKEIKGLNNLTKIEKLVITDNQITKLDYFTTFPPFVEGRLELFFEDNPITTPPRDVYAQGREAILSYYAQIEKEKGETEYLFEAKLLVIGEGGSGKTSFATKMLDVEAELPTDEETTLGIDVKRWRFTTNFPRLKGEDEVNFYVNLWDFGGQELYRGTHEIFFYDKSLYVLVADTRKQDTHFAYWLNTVEQLGGEKSILLIVLNKKYGHEVKFDEGYKLHFRDVIKEIIPVDLNSDLPGIRQLQETVKNYLKKLDGIGDPLPPSWVKIREVLSKEAKNFISFDRFRDICAEHDITDTSMIQTLSGYYNRIGAITHYLGDPVLQHRVYLNSNWLVKTVYRVIDSDVAKKAMGRLTQADVNDMWADNELNYELPQLTELMHKFGLMYHVPHSDQYVIPAHLPVGQPYKQWAYAGEQNLLQFNYEFEKYMPQGILSHVIVLLHKYIKDQRMVWHKGVNIECDGAYAEIAESLGGKNAFEIRIAGNRKRELLAIIRQQFAEVFQPYKKLRYGQKVPCNCETCRGTAEKHFYDYNKLVEMKSNGKRTIGCEQNPYHDVSIEGLIDSVDVPIEMERGKGGSRKSTNKKTGKKVFISYSHKDEKTWKNPLCQHLTSLNDTGLIETWHDRKIEPGKWDAQIEQAMEEADVFLLLITSNFISSDYISTKEITTAYRKHKEGRAEIFPIICSACKWEIKPLGEDKDGAVKMGDLQAYPKDAKPIKNWQDKEEGFLDVVNQLERWLKSS